MHSIVVVLPGAVGPDQAEDLTVVNVEGHVVDGDRAAVRLADLRDLNDRMRRAGGAQALIMGLMVLPRHTHVDTYRIEAVVEPGEKSAGLHERHQGRGRRADHLRLSRGPLQPFEHPALVGE